MGTRQQHKTLPLLCCSPPFWELTPVCSVVQAQGVCPLQPLPREKGLPTSPQKPRSKIPTQPQSSRWVVLAKPGNAMPCCHLSNSRGGGGGGVTFEEIKRAKRAELPPKLLGYSCAGGEDGCSQRRHSSLEPSSREGLCQSPCRGGEPHSPSPPPTHPRGPKVEVFLLEQLGATIRCSQQEHERNTHKGALCWDSVRSATGTLQGKPG